MLDSLTGKHGNYQVVKSLPASIKYVTKEGNYLIFPENLNLAELADGQTQNGKKLKTDSIAMKISPNSDLILLKESSPGFLMMNLQKIQRYQTFLQIKEKKDLMDLPYPTFQTASAMKATPQSILAIQNFILEVIAPFKKGTIARVSPIPRGVNGLFISGPTGIGKSHFIGELSKYFSIYHMPHSEKFYDYYSDNTYDLAVLDEFNGNKTIQFLNDWIDGKPIALAQKGSQTMKRDGLPTIILSNYKLEECFPNVYETKLEVFKTLRRRLIEVILEENTKLDFWFYRNNDKISSPSNILGIFYF